MATIDKLTQIQCCWSWMFIANPGFRIQFFRSRIQGWQDPGSRIRIKEWKYFSVWRIRDVYSRIPDPTFFHPGSRIRTVSIPDPGSSSKNLSILTPKKAKKWFLSSKKYDPGCSSRIPDPDADFLPSRRHPIPDPGSATLVFLIEKPDTGSVTLPEYVVRQA